MWGVGSGAHGHTPSDTTGVAATSAPMHGCLAAVGRGTFQHAELLCSCEVREECAAEV